MAHISELGLFDYLAGWADLIVEETEHLQKCDDCRELAMEIRQIIQDSGDVSTARRFVAEGKLSSSRNFRQVRYGT